jgi:hypothetical protein
MVMVTELAISTPKVRSALAKAPHEEDVARGQEEV